jgi:hypothetical protein
MAAWYNDKDYRILDITQYRMLQTLPSSGVSLPPRGLDLIKVESATSIIGVVKTTFKAYNYPEFCELTDLIARIQASH